MTVARIALPPKLVSVFSGEASVRGAYGGRGSGKTRSFAKMTAVWGYRLSKAGKRGVILCAREYMNSLAESSFAEVREAILEEPFLAAHYDIGEKFIRTKDRRIDYSFSGLHVASNGRAGQVDSLKSRARMHLMWVDEAEAVSETAWAKAIPSVREDDAELWVTWNPERKTSATHKRFRQDPPAGSKIIELNWRDNPRFPKKLQADRAEDEAKRPDSYAHIWEGDFRGISEGAYYAAQLTAARAQGRIGRVAADPLMQVRAFWDIGVRDHTAIWVAQFVGREVRVLNHYEAGGQPLGAHLTWLRSCGYGDALCVLPHDGAHVDQVTATRFEDHICAAGFDVEVVKNQGRGAAMQRVESARRLFPSIWFNEATTEAGIEALAAYHERRDDKREIGLGPEHDWASHSADAFGLMCVAYEEPFDTTATKQRPAGVRSWMGS